MASNKSFHLRWNNHLQNLRTLFESIYNEQNLVDVTLSCSDGLLRAHKLVLSACSPYFETVFRDNPCKHPVVILKGIQLQEMQTLLEYMYIGSVDVMEDDLEMLLNVANELQVKGLVQKQPLVNGSSTEKRTTKIDNEKKFSKDVSPVHQPEKQWKKENVFSVDSDGLRYTKRKNSNSSKSADNISHGSENTSQGGDNSGYYEGLDSGTTDETNNVSMALHPLIKVEECEDSKVADPEVDYTQNTSSTSITTDGAASQEKPSLSKTQEMIDEHDEDATFCLICTKNFHSKQNLRRHLQTHTGEKPHRCEYCELSFLRLSHLQRHIRVHTGERPYACSLCPKQFSRSDKLKQHVSLHHTGYQPKLGKKPRGRPRLHPAGSDGQPVPCESVLSSPSTNTPAFNSLSLPMHFSDITVSHVTSPS